MIAVLVPLFPRIPELIIAQAILMGLTCVVFYLAFRRRK